MYKIATNRSYTSFRLSKEAVKKGKELAPNCPFWAQVDLYGPSAGYLGTLPRHNKVLVKVIEELGGDANTEYSELDIVKINSPLYRFEKNNDYEYLITPDKTSWHDASR